MEDIGALMHLPVCALDIRHRSIHGSLHLEAFGATLQHQNLRCWKTTMIFPSYDAVDVMTLIRFKCFAFAHSNLRRTSALAGLLQLERDFARRLDMLASTHMFHMFHEFFIWSSAGLCRVVKHSHRLCLVGCSTADQSMRQTQWDQITLGS